MISYVILTFMPPQVLRLSRYMKRGDAFHLARAIIHDGEAVGMHRHDFAEVFWIDRGSGTHRINGQSKPLESGQIVLMRRSDRHELRAGRDGMTLVNVAFPATALTQLRSRYGRNDAAWPWHARALPTTVQLDEARSRDLTAWADVTAGRGASRLELDYFLLRVLRMIRAPAVLMAPQQIAPDWLTTALRSFATPDDLRGGAARLSRLAHHSPEHLNRVVRRCYGKTTTDLINDVRLDRAARDLRMTGTEIVDIAVDCGLSNLGHFYKLFNAKFGMTPRRYRLTARATMP